MIDLARRSRDIFDPENITDSITIIGAGSIGSNTALLLARMGLKNITVVDFDEVEDHNLGHQCYSTKHIGMKKVEALKDVILEATETEINIKDEKLEEGVMTDILILGTDNMASRKQISELSTYNFLVDGRMGGEEIAIYALSSLEMDEYNKTLYSDEEAVDLSCGGRSIGYVSNIISAYIGIVVKKILLQEEFPFCQNICAKNIIHEASKFQ